MSKAKELQDQGVKLYEQHDYEAAAKAFQDAQEAYQQDNQADMVAEMKVNIGLVHRALGESQQALDMMLEALRYFQETDDKLRTAQVLGNLGGVYRALNDKDQAYQAYRQAADAFKDMNETNLYSETLLALGSMQMRDGKWLMGAATYQVGLEALPSLNARQKFIMRLMKLIQRLNGQG